MALVVDVCADMWFASIWSWTWANFDNLKARLDRLKLGWLQVRRLFEMSRVDGEVTIWKDEASVSQRRSERERRWLELWLFERERNGCRRSRAFWLSATRLEICGPIVLGAVKEANVDVGKQFLVERLDEETRLLIADKRHSNEAILCKLTISHSDRSCKFWMVQDGTQLPPSPQESCN